MITVIVRDLSTYDPADAREQGHRWRMLALADSAGDAATARSHLDPGHFTASAFVLSPDGDSLLLVYHRRLARWLQPGGHIDAADPGPAAAACREVREETGLSGLVAAGAGLFDVDVHRIPDRPGEPAHDHFDLRYLFRAAATELRPGHDVSDAAWVSLGAVGARTADESVHRALRKLPPGVA